MLFSFEYVKICEKATFEVEMARNEFLIRTYKDIPYDKRLVWAREILDECYVFDISNGGLLLLNERMQKIISSEKAYTT